jgi:arginyl-tRNA synthetase
MKPVLENLEQRISEALQKATGLEGCPAMVRAAADAKFGDYQANGIMAAAKQVKTNPRQLAEKVVAQLALSDICQTPEIAGLINLRLNRSFGPRPCWKSTATKPGY